MTIIFVLLVDTVGLPILEQQLANVNVPDISGSTSISVIGTIDYSLSRYIHTYIHNIHLIDIDHFSFFSHSIKLANLQIPNSDIKSGATGLTVQASGISLSGNANWHYRESSWYR